jgi:methyl-accepting chemotaxis protein
MILPDIQKTADLVQEICTASDEQNKGVTQINKAIQQLDQIISQNAGASEEMASTAEELSSQAERLLDMITFFKVDEEDTYKDIDLFTNDKKELTKPLILTDENRIDKNNREISEILINDPDINDYMRF